MQQSRKVKKVLDALGWPAASAILLAAIVTELLPVASSPLSESSGLFCVTMHFVAIPIACVCHVAWNTWGAAYLDRRPDSPLSYSAALSVIIPVTYLLASAFWPKPFAGLLVK